MALWKSHTGAGYWQDRWTHGGPTLKQSVREGLHPWKGPTLQQFVKSCSLWEGSHAEAGGECEEERVAETTWDELIATPIPCPSALLGMGRR